MLGSLLISPSAFALVSNKLSAADFYRPDHRTIYAAIAALSSERNTADAVSVSEYLGRRGLSGETDWFAYLARLAHDTPTAANIETYAAAVRDCSSRRRLRILATKS